MSKKTCCICGKEINGWGNDPYPVVTDNNAECCDACNMTYILPARIARLQMAEMVEGGRK